MNQPPKSIFSSQQIKYDDDPDLAAKLGLIPGEIKKFEVFIYPLFDGYIGDSLFTPDTVQLREIIDQLLTGLEQLIDAGKCHNDLKPTNMLYRYQSNKYTIKISDFAQCGTQGGTPGWTAPVFLESRQPGKEDMYSLGLVILRLLCADQVIFHCLRDNFVQDTKQQWMVDFKSMAEIKFIMKMMNLDKQPTLQEIKDEWIQIKPDFKIITAQRLLQLSIPRQYLQLQYNHTE